MSNTTQKPPGNDVRLSKKLSWLLRHGLKKEGFQIQPDGFIKVDELLKHPHYCRDYSLTTLQRLVEQDAKQRYTLRKNPLQGYWEIRANQGHSLEEIEADQCLQLLPSAQEVPMAVHGTYYRHWNSIKSGGLKRFQRNHIHFATSDCCSNNVSGFRSDCQILIYLNVDKVFREGKLQLYRSDNNVILCSGLEDGSIPPTYFLKVVDRKTGRNLEF
ncbi:tRNA 2'-phosphotransferase 1-like [Musca vetustissima]|uniref:tRNA 2'-phosphotransferase 1-like n=1 Tax=Musca vetustissima TaxID=27455 RepID=UPI002AB5E3D3|nr:tRNA 2'-phosphotransferase 1-like [Musca vetustissima]